jgi:hypothetical protein
MPDLEWVRGASRSNAIPTPRARASVILARAVVTAAVPDIAVVARLSKPRPETLRREGLVGALLRWGANALGDPG